VANDEDGPFELAVEGLGQGREEAIALMDRAFVGMLAVLVDRAEACYVHLEMDKTPAGKLLAALIEAKFVDSPIGAEVVRLLTEAEAKMEALND